MTMPGWMQLGLYVVVLLLLVKPLGSYMAAVYEGRAGRAQRLGGWLERLVYRIAGVDPGREMNWIAYALAMLWFNLAGALVVYALQRLQVLLPLNPQDFAAGGGRRVPPRLVVSRCARPSCHARCSAGRGWQVRSR